MTRKDYELMARALRLAKERALAQQHHASIAHSAWCETVRTVADELAHDNPRFDYHLFLRNAGVES